jgi:hypothetical protein
MDIFFIARIVAALLMLAVLYAFILRNFTLEDFRWYRRRKGGVWYYVYHATRINFGGYWLHNQQPDEEKEVLRRKEDYRQ